MASTHQMPGIQSCLTSSRPVMTIENVSGQCEMHPEGQNGSQLKTTGQEYGYQKHGRGVYGSGYPIPVDTCEDYLSIFTLLNSAKIIQSLFIKAFTHVTHTPMKTQKISVISES